MGFLSVAKRHTFTEGWVKDVGEQPWKLALLCQAAKLLLAKVKVMVLRVLVSQSI